MRGVMICGQTVRELRKKAGLTQEQLAVDADCDPKTIGKAERSQGRVDLHVAVAIAEALDCSTEAILETSDSTRNDSNIQLVHAWNDALCSWDLEKLLAFHTDDTVLEIVGAHGVPAEERYEGIAQLKAHFEETSKILRLVWWDKDTIQITAVDNLVFMRSDATIEYAPNGKTYTTRHFNEFEFRDRLISRRVVIADYEGLRRILNDT